MSMYEYDRKKKKIIWNETERKKQTRKRENKEKKEKYEKMGKNNENCRYISMCLVVFSLPAPYHAADNPDFFCLSSDRLFN